MSVPPHQTGTAKSNGLNLFYRRFGTAGRTPVLIAHGLSYFSYDWIDVAAALATDREVVALDMRGFGESDWSPDKDYSIPANARDFIAVLDHLEWPKAVLIGHSLGGRFCTYCAAEYPTRAAALVSVDFAPAQAPEGSARVAEIVGHTPDVFATIDEALRYYGADLHSPQGSRSRARFEAYLRRVEGGYAVKRDPIFRDNFRRILKTGVRPKLPVDMWEVLGRVRCPILVVRGTRSDMFTPEIAQRLQEARPDLELVEIDAGHNVAGENPEAFLAAVQGFLPRAAGRYDRSPATPNGS